MKGWPGEPDMDYDVLVADGEAAALTLLADSIIMLMVYRRCFTAEDQYQPIAG